MTASIALVIFVYRLIVRCQVMAAFSVAEGPAILSAWGRDQNRKSHEDYEWREAVLPTCSP